MSGAAEHFHPKVRASESESTPTVAAGSRRDLDDKSAAYMSRIMYLQNEAASDGYQVSPPSEIDFWQFVRSAPKIRKGNLVLMDNGNLRATWRDEGGSRLSLQFLGDRTVQYVIFCQRKQEQPMSRVTGRDSFEGLARQIDAFDLYTLLYE